MRGTEDLANLEVGILPRVQDRRPVRPRQGRDVEVSRSAKHGSVALKAIGDVKQWVGAHADTPPFATSARASDGTRRRRPSFTLRTWPRAMASYIHVRPTPPGLRAA